MKCMPPCFPLAWGPGWLGSVRSRLWMWSLVHRVCFINVTVMNWNIQGMVSFQGSSGRPWQFFQKKRGIPLDSPIMQILNLTYDPPEVWCPMKEAVTSSQMADSKVNKERPSLGLYPVRELEGSSCDWAGVAVSSSAGGLPLITKNWKIVW